MNVQRTGRVLREHAGSVLVAAVSLLCMPARAGEIQKLYANQSNRSTTRPSTTRAADAKPEITEIGIERTLCFGTCPVYTLIIRSDGTFRYLGEKYVQREGRHTGRIGNEKFERLAQFALEIGFTNFTDYSRPVTDNPTVFTMIVLDGRPKIVRDYAQAGPAKLLEFDAMIDQSLQDAQWD